MSRQAYPTQLRDDRGNESPASTQAFRGRRRGCGLRRPGQARPKSPSSAASPRAKNVAISSGPWLSCAAPTCSRSRPGRPPTLNAGNPPGVDGILDAQGDAATWRSTTSTAWPGTARRTSPHADGGSSLARHGEELRDRLRGGPRSRARGRGRQPEECDEVLEGQIVAFVECEVVPGRRGLALSSDAPSASRKYTPPSGRQEFRQVSTGPRTTTDSGSPCWSSTC